eukprot:92437-Alexandrium_andersonii.AAC.1
MEGSEIRMCNCRSEDHRWLGRRWGSFDGKRRAVVWKLPFGNQLAQFCPRIPFRIVQPQKGARGLQHDMLVST